MLAIALLFLRFFEKKTWKLLAAPALQDLNMKRFGYILEQLATPAPNTFVFHNYREDFHVNLIVRQTKMGNWQGVVIFVLHIANDSTLQPQNVEGVLRFVQDHLGQQLETVNPTWYFIKGDRAYVLQNNEFQLVRPELFIQPGLQLY